MQCRLNMELSKKKTQVAKKHLNGQHLCHQKVQIKTTLKIHLKTVRKAQNIKNKGQLILVLLWGLQGTFIHADRKANLFNNYENWYGGPLASGQYIHLKIHLYNS